MSVEHTTVGLLLLLLPVASCALEYKAYPVSHPVVTAKLSASAVRDLQTSVAPALKFSEQEVRELLRPMTGFQEMPPMTRLSD